MNIKNKNHHSYYFSLITLLIVSAVVVMLSIGNRELQLIIFILTAIFYVLLGILHHLFDHNLSSKIVTEYVLIGALGISIVFFIYMGGKGI